jgi:hypothetical protein
VLPPVGGHSSSSAKQTWQKSSNTALVTRHSGQSWSSRRGVSEVARPMAVRCLPVGTSQPFEGGVEFTVEVAPSLDRQVGQDLVDSLRGGIWRRPPEPSSVAAGLGSPGLVSSSLLHARARVATVETDHGHDRAIPGWVLPSHPFPSHGPTVLHGNERSVATRRRRSERKESRTLRAPIHRPPLGGLDRANGRGVLVRPTSR